MKIKFKRFEEILVGIFMRILLLFCIIFILALIVNFIGLCYNSLTACYVIRCNGHTYFTESYEIDERYISFTDSDKDFVKCPKDITEIIKN